MDPATICAYETRLPVDTVAICEWNQERGIMSTFVTDESCSRLYCWWKAIIFYCSRHVGDISWFELGILASQLKNNHWNVEVL